jgi:renal tumor antigen
LIRGEDIKLADFGCCKGVFADMPHTEYISTRWYRPPECLMTDGYYDAKVLF